MKNAALLRPQSQVYAIRSSAFSSSSQGGSKSHAAVQYGAIPMAERPFIGRKGHISRSLLRDSVRTGALQILFQCRLSIGDLCLQHDSGGPGMVK